MSSSIAAREGKIQEVFRHEFTTMTVVLALLVIYSHVTSHALLGYDKSSLAYGFVYFTKKLCAIAFYGFIFMSSAKYFATPRSESFRYGAFMLRRVRKIVLPYILWVLIYYAYFLRHGYFPFSVPELVKYILTGTLVAHFYFIIVIMQFYLLMPLWHKLAKMKTAPIAAITAACFIVTVISQNCFPNFIYSDRIFPSYLFFWMLGILCGSRYDKFVGLLTRHRAMLLVEGAIIAAHLVLGYFSSRGIISYPYANTWHLVYVTALIFFAMYFAVVIKPEKIPFWRLLTAISGASFYIYLTHILVLFIVDSHTPGATITQRLILRLVFAIVVPVALSIAYTTLSKKIRGRSLKAKAFKP